MLKRFFQLFRKSKPESLISPKLQEEMNQFIIAIQNRPVYRELSQKILEATAEDELELLVVDNLCAIIGADDREEWAIVQDFTAGQQAVYTTWMVEEEIWENGFNTFYRKPVGRYAELVLQGFHAIGAPELANIMKEANMIFHYIQSEIKTTEDHPAEGADMDNHPLLDELDNEFYELSMTENLHDLRTAYIQAHPAAFLQVA